MRQSSLRRRSLRARCSRKPDDPECPPLCSGHYQRKSYFVFCNSETTAVVSELLFHGKGRNGKRHLLTLAPCGSIRVSMKTCCCPYVSSRSDSKPAEHKKSSSAAAWIFCMEPNSFGVTRGEQPLVRASRASKVAGAFLVLFCVRKRVHTRRRCILQKALNFKHATTLCAENLYFSTFRLCRV